VGSRTADKLKEIEDLRASLGSKLEEIERRVPLAGFGKKAVAAIAGTTVAAPALAFLLRRARPGRARRTRKAKKSEGAMPASVTVNVFPKGAAWLAAAGLAGWAGMKIYETLQRSRNGDERGSFKPSVVTPIPEPGRQMGP
jgi:branched-subunit amino acid ABC-type transport system permease component